MKRTGRAARARALATLVVALLAAVALAVSPASAAPGRVGAPKPGQAPKGLAASASGSGTGIVQAVSPRAVLVRQLDGSIVRVGIGARTLVVVNGTPAALTDVKPGFVASFVGPRRGPARELRVTNPSPHKAKLPTVQSVTADAVLATLPDGSPLSIPVGPRTHVFIDGAPATLAEIRPGDRVAVGAGAAAARKPVRELRLRRLG